MIKYIPRAEERAFRSNAQNHCTREARGLIWLFRNGAQFQNAEKRHRNESAFYRITPHCPVRIVQSGRQPTAEMCTRWQTADMELGLGRLATVAVSALSYLLGQERCNVRKYLLKCLRAVKLRMC